jgi:hypothetical protein
VSGTKFDAGIGMPFTAPDVVWALGLSGGTIEGSRTAVDRLDVSDNGKVETRDVTRLRRKVSGTEPNP